MSHYPGCQIPYDVFLYDIKLPFSYHRVTPTTSFLDGHGGI